METPACHKEGGQAAGDGEEVQLAQIGQDTTDFGEEGGPEFGFQSNVTLTTRGTGGARVPGTGALRPWEPGSTGRAIL